ncbi:2-amino-4-hydroxy-6-hydroxymethyldihydropteridine diphosphokinase [Qipengyuania thermophila]|uniref:2-amino-4-hydroxy-6- hydroxymethyldihydropteridine diphosphokinase n=1 Tax=Qipengyuania thermophila TaxID=2509361 RepID=UPI001F387E88|nr:2-amino-4-hydroxy-6-hydroxymethyldihydropteridine diphosphokinase [Qipengyuania thermophila]
MLAEAVRLLRTLGEVEAVAPVLRSAPLGPSRRRYANGALVLASALEPLALLAALKELERRLGRRPGGQRWSARVLDCDIVLWSGGGWRSRDLTIPHSAFRARCFVLRPLAAVAPLWRDPATGLTPRHLLARLTRPRPLTR